MAEKGGGVWYLKLGKRTYRDEKLKAIRTETGSSDFFQIWIAFLCLAVCEKRDGSLYVADRKPYTAKLLAQEIGFPLDEMEKAIRIFEEYDMIAIVDGVIWLRNWDKYQSVKTDEEYRAKGAERVRKHRAKKAEEEKQQEAPTNIPPEATAEGWYEPGELQRIQEDHNELLDLAERIGLITSEWDREQVIQLYAEHGKEKTAFAMQEAAKQKKISIAYIEGIIRNHGKEKTESGSPFAGMAAKGAT